MSKRLDPLGLNCLQKLSTDDTSWQNYPGAMSELGCTYSESAGGHMGLDVTKPVIRISKKARLSLPSNTD